MSYEEKKILLVEDETEVAKIIRDYLLQANYTVELIHTGEGVVDQVRSSPPNLILLDIMLPVVDGVTICKEIRAFSDVPIIMLTAKVDEIDRIIGYEIGADDYICKPVNPREILARVKTVLRRITNKSSSTSSEVENNKQAILELDESRLLAVYQGSRLDVTLTEFRLLKLLSRNEGKIYSRKQIRNKIYSAPNNDSGDRAIDTCVKKLRSKISAVSEGENPIQSVYGVGYKFEQPDQSG